MNLEILTKFDEEILSKKWGDLTPIEVVGRTLTHIKVWKCLCDCGNYIEVPRNHLNRGFAKHCGCKDVKEINIEQKLKEVHKNMRLRCCNPNHPRYFRYGGRGITVCDEWRGVENFENFYKWAIESGYKHKLELDRIDNDKGYSPENCRWSTRKEQANNRRTNVKINYRGNEYTVSELMELFGITRHKMDRLLKNNNYNIDFMEV